MSHHCQESSVICPYCDYKFKDSSFFNNKQLPQYYDIHYECENCKKVISIELHITYKYSTYEIDSDGNQIYPV